MHLVLWQLPKYSHYLIGNGTHYADKGGTDLLSNLHWSYSWQTSPLITKYMW